MIPLIIFTIFLHIVWIWIFTHFLHTDLRSLYFFCAGILANVVIAVGLSNSGNNIAFQNTIPIVEELLKWIVFLPALAYLRIFSSEKSLISIALMIATGFSLSEAFIYIIQFTDSVPWTVMIIKNMSGIKAHNVFSSITATGTIFAVYELYRHIDHHDYWLSMMMKISKKSHISPEGNMRLYRASVILGFIILGSLSHTLYNALVRSSWFQFFPLRTLIITILISYAWHLAHATIIDTTLNNKYGKLIGRINRLSRQKEKIHQ